MHSDQTKQIILKFGTYTRIIIYYYTFCFPHLLTMELITLAGGECSNTGDIQEKTRQPSVRSDFIQVPAPSRGLVSMAL